MPLKDLRNTLRSIAGAMLARWDRKYHVLAGYLKALRHDQALLRGKYYPAVRDDLAFVVRAFATKGAVLDPGQIKRAIALFEEPLDRQTYRAELAHLLSRESDEELAALFSPFSREEFEDAGKALRRMAADGSLPRVYGDAKDMTEGYLGYSLTTTFVVGQYQYAPHVTVGEGDIFLDCGACYGETAVWALSKGARKVYSFEPNEGHYALLEKNAAQMGTDRMVPLKYGIGKADGELWIREDGAGSRIVDSREKADYAVRITSLDSFCAKNGVIPDFIKMDIEGAELDALRGAEETIRRHRPKLAVCLYHGLEDMWTIPLFIHSLGAGYSFWCRKNDPKYEFVLYAAAKGPQGRASAEAS